MVLSLSRFFQNSRLNQETEQRSTFAAEQSEQLASANAEIARLRQELQTKEDDIRVKNREIDDLNFSKFPFDFNGEPSPLVTNALKLL